jgi:hypothetical protein
MEAVVKGLLLKIAAGAACALTIATGALAAGPMSVTTNFPTALWAGDPFRTELLSIGVGTELASPTLANVYAPSKLTFSLLESRAPSGGLQITSLTVDGTAYAFGPQAFSPPGTVLGSQVFSGAFASKVGFNDNIFGPDAPPVMWPDGIQVYIKSEDEDNLSGIGPFIGDFNRLYFSIGDAALFSVTYTAVPEPGTWALMITGFMLTGAAARRRHIRVIRA